MNGRHVLAWEVLFRYSHIKIFNVKSMDAMSLKIRGMISKYCNFEFMINNWNNKNTDKGRVKITVVLLKIHYVPSRSGVYTEFFVEKNMSVPIKRNMSMSPFSHKSGNVIN